MFLCDDVKVLASCINIKMKRGIRMENEVNQVFGISMFGVSVLGHVVG